MFHTYERRAGNLGADPKTGRSWGLGVFRTSTTNDIINVSSALVPMFGYFQNAAKTRRQGVEAKVNTVDRVHLANYTFIDATYQSAMTLQSPNNPAADDNIQVRPGDHIPALPSQRFKAGFEHNVTDAHGWLRPQCDRQPISAARHSNQNARVPAYWTVNVHASYQLTQNVQIYGLIQNLFDQRYYSVGTFVNSPAPVPAWRPSSPFCSGPTLFCAAGPMEWHGRHLRNDFSPAATSCAQAAPGLALTVTEIIARPAKSIFRMANLWFLRRHLLSPIRQRTMPARARKP